MKQMLQLAFLVPFECPHKKFEDICTQCHNDLFHLGCRIQLEYLPCARQDIRNITESSAELSKVILMVLNRLETYGQLFRCRSLMEGQDQALTTKRNFIAP